MGRTIADHLAKTLTAVGAERIWGVTGDSLNGLSDSLNRMDSIRWMHTRHEEVAAFAAGADAAATGRLTHHPHVHGIVPGGGLSPDGERWIACRPGFFLPVRVLSHLFRRRFLEALQSAHHRGGLQFFGEYAGLADAAIFARWLAPLRTCE